MNLRIMDSLNLNNDLLKEKIAHSYEYFTLDIKPWILSMNH